MSSPDLTFTTHSADETIALGHHLSTLLPATGPVLLIGNLGAGKTTLVKGIAAARGAATEEEVNSPTFPLIHEYGDPPRVFHIDLYRLDTVAEVLSLGLDELMDRPALMLIEWGERFPSLWPSHTPQLHLEHLPDDSRRIRFVPR